MLTVSAVIVTDLVPLRDRGLYQGEPTIWALYRG
jgi:hypothetical protein